MSEFFSTGLDCVGTNSEGSLSLVGLKKLNKFSRIEEIEEMINKFKVIAIVAMKETTKLVYKVFARFASS